MTLRNALKSVFLFIALSSCAAAWAASLEYGKIRARTRGWLPQETRAVEEEPLAEAPVSPALEEEIASVEETPEDEWEPEPTLEEEWVEEDWEAEATVEPELEKAPSDVGPAKGAGRSMLRRGKLLLLSSRKEKEPSLLDGYLTVGAAPLLRFSDIDPVNSRPQSPALPEFNFVSNEYVPYLIEEALPEDALNDTSLLSELVIEMEPHTVVSGKIDTRRHKQEEQVEDFQLEEQRTTVLRPEEVLIFFETDTANGSSGAVIPFAPATPNTTIKSKATLTKE